MRSRLWLSAWLAVFALVGCSTLPRSDPAVESARSAVDAVRADPVVAQYAPLELRRMQDAWQRAERAWREGDDTEVVHHFAYLADRQAALARETARLRAAQAAISQADTERARIRLEARTREADRAREEAARAQATAAQQAQQAEAARATALIAAERARAEQARAAAAHQQAANANERAQAANSALSDLRSRTDQLAAEVKGLKAKTTNQGTVITLGDVLFDVDRATLNPGGDRAVRELASALEDGSASRITIAGFTDATGASQYNQSLSEDRAEAVRDVLVDAGIPAERVVTRGYGEAYPVATNNTTAGRQLNRRVEVFVDERAAAARESTSAGTH
jgi:outer membrane protein OmpA-like peptidoglycan-associated protein